MNGLTPIKTAARLLHVQPAWLESEIREGRLPGLIAGESVLVNLRAMEVHLLLRSSRAAPAPVPVPTLEAAR